MLSVSKQTMHMLLCRDVVNKTKLRDGRNVHISENISLIAYIYQAAKYAYTERIDTRELLCMVTREYIV